MKNKLSRYLFALALCIINRAWGFSGERTVLVNFENSPFPFNEPETQTPPFFDVVENGRRGHTSIRGGVYWEDQTYNDKRVLMSLSPRFNLKKQPVIIVYFHGNQATLERDVIDRQKIPAQIAKAGLNALLLAPQFAVDAQDSSVGHFADEGFFGEFLHEAADQMSRWKNNEKYQQLNQAPVIVVAYSGGYQAAAYAVERGGVRDRIAGVILMDALYGHEDKFTDWVQDNKEHSFLFSCYTESARTNNEYLQHQLSLKKLNVSSGVPSRLTSGGIHFLNLHDENLHNELLTYAWTDNPLTDLLRRLSMSNRNK